MDQPTQTESDHHERPVVVIVFTGLLLTLAAGSVIAVAIGSLRWPVPVLVAVICVILAQGIWRLREWARLVTAFLLGASLVVVPLAVAGYWWAIRIVPIADLLAIICACPPVIPLGYLLYWFLSHDMEFE